MLKIAYLNNANSSDDKIRGIGVHSNELIKALDKIIKNTKDFEIDLKINKSKHYDIVHFTSFRPFFISLPFLKPKNTKFILTIHDLIPLIYPNNYPPGFKGKLNYFINKLLVKMYVDEIITITETSKKDICRFLKVDPKIVHVIYLASKEIYKKINPKNTFKLPKEFVIYLGDINYNKNIPTLVKACEKLSILLVIAGKHAKELETMGLNHPELIHLKPIYETLVDPQKVKRLGYISDDEVNNVLNLASVLVQPSYYEGFGFPIIEAFETGCPVVSGKTQALVEVGDEACLYFDTQSVDDLMEKISEVINNKDLRKKIIANGFNRIKKFSWEKAAIETIKVYKNIFN